MVRSFCAVLCFFIFGLSGSALAQTQITTGVIRGIVQDQSGAIIVGADVTAKNLDTQTEVKQQTDSDGQFVFLSLRPGRYSVNVTKGGFSTVVQKDLDLTVGQAISLRLSLKISAVNEIVEVSDSPVIEPTESESSTTINETALSATPALGRKFEDMLTLTPGVTVVQGPDGDEISFAGQRGIFNNVSLDGGDYNNGFFGEQAGGQRAAIDITLEAVKEFQVVASGASAEFGRTAGGVINVITKSGTDQVHGSLFHFQRLQALAADTSDGKPLQDFHREQFGSTIGGPIVKEKMFYFGAVEQIFENLVRPNLSVQQGPVGCPVSAPTLAANSALLGSNADCQRLALINFFQTTRNQQEGLPVEHPVRNTALLGKYDWNVNNANKLSASYNFDRSNNANQTFDVPTYGDSANGIEGSSKINSVNVNLFTTVSSKRVNEGHFSFSREDRPRSAVPSNVPADTAMGFATTFRFGEPFFLEPKVDETFKRYQIRDNFSILAGKHTIKFGGEWLHSNNTQVFRGFFTGRYIFDSVLGFLHYASPTSLGAGFGPATGECPDGSFVNLSPTACAGGTPATSPLLLYLQHAGTNGATTDAAGASNISNENYSLFLQDKWQIRPNLTLDYGLRWEAQTFPDPVIPPSQTAYGVNLGDPRFPSTGKLPNALAMFQPRLGLAWDVRNNGKSVVHASWGIFNAQQNMLTQVGAITTNGVQQQSLFSGDVPGGFIGANGGFDTPGPTWPNAIVPPAVPAGSFPFQPGVVVFDKNYKNPRIYAANFGFAQELAPGWAAYLDLTWSKAVFLTRFVDPNNGSQLSGAAAAAACAAAGATLSSDGVCIPLNGDTAIYPGPSAFSNLGSITDTQSTSHSLYRGMTVGIRKRLSHGVQLEANYVLSEDLDDDSNERDPFTFRYFDRFNFRKDYTFSDRDSRHKFNLYAYTKLPAGFGFSARIQAHTAQPITDNPLGTGTGAPCSPSNSLTRVVGGIDCGRNHLRKDNGFFTFNWRAERPFHFSENVALTPMVEMFNSFNNRNNINPLVTPGLFNFDGFLREGVGDPLQAQLALKLTF
ncbi:MAG TPA: carboxypeptidase regulatory-like domain-containing protein [Candidatus Angelobacter sp.]|nr:carboxypeptidase regulatory-like domain-containing protein [Candidatus Angelobacter sp.]